MNNEVIRKTAKRDMNPLSNTLFPILLHRCEEDEEKEKSVRNLLNSIIGGRNGLIVTRITKTAIEETLPGEGSDLRTSRLDMTIETDDGSICLVELQFSSQKNIVPRLLFYFSHHRMLNMPAGPTDYAMPQYALITLTDYRLDILKDEDLYHLYTTLRADNATHVQLTDRLQIHLVSMHRFRELTPNPEGSELAQWMYYFAGAYRDEEKVKELVSMNEHIKVMDAAYGMAIEDPATRRKYLYELILRQGIAEDLAEARKDGQDEERAKMQSEIDKRDAIIEALRAQLAKQGKE